MSREIGQTAEQIEGLAETTAGLERLVGRFKLVDTSAAPVQLGARSAAAVRLRRAA